MIQTSYFASKAPRGRKVCIAKWPPRYWQGPCAPKLAPSNPKAENWAGRYRQDLEERFPDAGSLRDYLADIERRTPEPILCCFESDPEQCHRRVLAAYIKELLGIDVLEWQSPGSCQKSLF